MAGETHTRNFKPTLVTLHPRTIQRAKAAAKRHGLSFSAFADLALQRLVDDRNLDRIVKRSNPDHPGE